MLIFFLYLLDFDNKIISKYYVIQIGFKMKNKVVFKFEFFFNFDDIIEYDVEMIVYCG